MRYELLVLFYRVIIGTDIPVSYHTSRSIGHIFIDLPHLRRDNDDDDDDDDDVDIESNSGSAIGSRLPCD